MILAVSQLSAYHLRRPRPAGRVLGARVRVIVAGAGYGKSALAAEAAEAAEFLDMPVIATALAGVLDAMLEALAGSGVMIVVDEVQQAEPEALALLTRLAGQLGADQRLLLLGREAPAGIASLRRDGAAV
jgi:hypothetical protein